MISELSIQEVLEAARIEEIIGEDVQLKNSGANLKGLSPFTAEKTPSFMVSPAKQIFKDFSSGKGGGVVTYLEERKGWSFPEAIKYLAEKYNVELRYEGKEQSKEQISAEKRLLNSLRAAARYYRDKYVEIRGNMPDYLTKEHHPAVLELEGNRLYSEETIIEWGLGYAPNEWRFLTEKVIPKGYYKECETLGLIKSKNGANFDVLRHRIIFPIHDHMGKLVGFGARALEGGQPKYLNSKENPIYDKSRVLYGLHKAADAIREEGFAYLVEGYTDVISMHQAGLCNAVATCGTSLTVKHARVLQRYTNHVVICRDGDPAGMRAAARDLAHLVKIGFKSDICQLPLGEDPDTVARQKMLA